MEIISNNEDNKSQMFAKIAFSVVGACAVGVTLGAIPFVTPALRRHCLPFIPATDAQIENVLKALRLCSTQRPVKTVLDIGSGDGR
uniref:Uncharacterized protein n=1 Tax=Romanomermis culicivorax TaxID=13658 RepID=A0A915KVJ5_ROMCU